MCPVSTVQASVVLLAALNMSASSPRSTELSPIECLNTTALSYMRPLSMVQASVGLHDCSQHVYLLS